MQYSQLILSIILLLMLGGTPLEAMQRYAPIWCLPTAFRVRVLLRTSETGKQAAILVELLMQTYETGKQSTILAKSLMQAAGARK